MKHITLHTGHVPDHVRDTFIEAVMAWCDWNGEPPEPLITREVNFEPTAISISRACGLVWNCTDALSGDEYAYLQDAGLPMRKSTYAAAARALVADIKRAPRAGRVGSYAREPRL